LEEPEQDTLSGFIINGTDPQGAESLPPPLRVAKTGKNHMNDEITPLLPTGIGEQYSQTMSNLGHAALLRRCELPLQTKMLN
jgi:hypothetical protein